MFAEYVYCYRGNYDGRMEGLVIAHNQKEAAKIAGCSVYSFRQWWLRGDIPDGLKPKDGTLYLRPMNGKGEWEERR